MLQPSEIERALVITAHPDDVDFGAAGTVAWLTDHGVEVVYCLVTDGDAGGFDQTIPRPDMAAMRREEQTRAAKEVGVERLVFLGHGDGRVVYDLVLRRDLSRVIRQVRPTVVITQSPERNLDRIYASHPDHLATGEAAVAAVYVVVTLGAQMLVDDRLIVAQREAAFAAVGAAALGETGRLMAVGGAVLATASAVNATLFSTSRLVRDIAEAGELPAVVGRTRGGLPVTAIVLLAAFGTVFAMLPTISALLSFGSVTFLAVFALINHLHARTADDASGRVLGHVGTAACVAAIAAVAVHLTQDDPASLMTITALVAVVLGLRQVHRRRGHRT